MSKFWEKSINEFIEIGNKYGVRMIMVGGGAVNFHGYQRHSADVDFWLDMDVENMSRLLKVFNELGYEIEEFPKKVLDGTQNVSIKFSPVDVNLELITSFTLQKSFAEAYSKSVVVEVEGRKYLKWNVLNLKDLIESKIKSGRSKDYLDIQELKKINKID